MGHDQKSISEWEKIKGYILPDATVTKKMSEADFDDIPLSEKVGINWTDRVKFLDDNGYDVNRKNLADAFLSAKPKDA